MAAAVFRTRAEQRRSLLLAGFPNATNPQLNGIDYVEVYDATTAFAFGLPGSRRQRVLRVRFLQSVWLDALGPEHLQIVGGERIPSVTVRAVVHGSLDGVGDVNDLWVLVDEAGDWSRYVFSLIAKAGEELPPIGFDPVLSRVTVSFKVDCPTDLDCIPETAAKSGDLVGPTIDYLGRDYESFRTLMLDRMSTLAPAWSERNVADVGVALVEAIAHVADGLSYYQDAVATEAYLATARRRASVRRHARLLDYRIHEGASARVFVSIEVRAGSALDGAVLVTGTPLLTQIDGRDPGIRVGDFEGPSLPEESLVFETLHDLKLKAKRNLVFFHTWGEEDGVLPAGSTRAVLVDPGAAVLGRGDVLIFVEQYAPDPSDPATGARRFADPKRRHAVRLVAEPTLLPPDPLFGTPLIEVQWHVRDALPFDLCLRVFDLPSGDTPQPGAVDPAKVAACVAIGNVVLADHGRRVPDEALPSAVEGEHYRPKLEHRDVAHTVAYDAHASETLPAVETLEIEPQQALPAVTLAGDGHTWRARYDLLASDAYAEEFVVEMRETRHATLRFGDGIHGRAPSGGRELVASYRVGGGRAGNVAAGAIQHVVVADAVDPGAISAVTNPLPAQGGTDPESIDRVKLLAPHFFKRQERAVRPDDYKEVAERHPEVQRAVANLRWTGSWKTVAVTVDRSGGRPVDDAFRRELLEHLEPFRMAGHDLEVRPPIFVALHLALMVRVESSRLNSEVERAVRVVLGSEQLANGELGFFHPDKLSFGQSIYLSQIIALVMGVSGVERVDVTDSRARFERFEDPSSNGLVEGQLRFGALEIPRLDADPNAPENGRLDVYAEGGL